MKEDALKVYDLWTGNTEDRNRKARTEHAANRPGEGMPDEAFIRQKKMEARQRLEDISLLKPWKAAQALTYDDT